MSEELQQGRNPGEWALILVGEFDPSPRYSAVVRCRDCARPLSLLNHSIAADGQVTPSIGHPESYPPCGWHPTLRLAGWPNLPNPPQSPIIAHCGRCQKPTRQLSGWSTWNGPGDICPECRAALSGDPHE